MPPATSFVGTCVIRLILGAYGVATAALAGVLLCLGR